MRQERWQQVKTILEQALEKDPAERAPFLDLACLDDAELRRDVESLIALDRQAESFLETPVAPLKDRNVSVGKNQTGGAADMLDRLIGEVIDDKYRIEELLGHGGMGAVYKAVHIGTDRTVAVKIIIPQFTANLEFIERFKREAKAAGRLRHPNVVNVTDFGFAEIDEKQLAYLVMEYLDGFTLGDLMEKKGKLPLGFAVDVMEQTCLALNAAHKQGIIHRDLKPDNIWLEPNGRGGFNVKILDFGLAKIRQTNLQSSIEETAKLSGQTWPAVKNADDTLRFESAADSSFSNAPTVLSNEANTLKIEQKRTGEQGQAQTDGEGLTRVGAILGTPLYMSPEQCKGEPIGAGSDIYSLGVIVYAMLAGETPFKGSPFFVIGQHIDAPPLPLRKKRRDIPKSVADLVMSALAKDPKERPVSALVFSNALRINAEGEELIIRESMDISKKYNDAIIAVPLLFYGFLHLIAAYLCFAPVESINSTAVQIIRKSYWIISIPLAILSAVASNAACTLAVEQTYQSNFTALKVKPIIIATLKRLPALIITTIQYYALTLIGLLKFVKPGIDIFAKYAFYAQTAAVEGLEGKDSFDRSKKLARDLHSVALHIQLRSLFVSFIAAFMPVLTSFICGVIQVLVFETWVWPEEEYNLFILFFLSLQSIGLYAILHWQSICSIAMALLFYKSRAVGGGENIDGDSQNMEAIRLQKYPNNLLTIKRFLNATALSVSLAFMIAVIFIFSRPLLWGSAESGKAYVVKALLAFGVDVNSRRATEGSTSLMMACSTSDKNNTEIIKMLLAAGADVNCKDDLGRTALHHAAGNRFDYVKLLINAGANINEKDNADETPLMATKNSRVIRALLAAGADFKVKNRSGKTALMIASEKKLEGIVELLKAAGAEE